MSAPESHEPISRRRQRARRRALKNLRIALAEAGDQLTPDWVARDPDLHDLTGSMAGDAEWSALLKQLEDARRDAPLTAEIPPKRDETVSIPTSPWPLLVPLVFWIATTGVFALLFVRAVTHHAYWMFILLAATGTVVSVLRLGVSIAARIRRRALTHPRRSQEPARGPRSQQRPE